MKKGIRIALLVLLGILLIIAIAVPLYNNSIAAAIEKSILAVPLPPDSELAASASSIGWQADSDAGLQYFGAILIKSSAPQAEIKAHYAQYSNGARSLIVSPQRSAEILAPYSTGVAFKGLAETMDFTDCYIVYAWESGNFALKEFDYRAW